MSDYTRQVQFTPKDSLPSGNAQKIITGVDFDDEYNAVQTAVNSKLNISNPTFTGTMNGGVIDGGTF